MCLHAVSSEIPTTIRGKGSESCYSARHSRKIQEDKERLKFVLLARRIALQQPLGFRLLAYLSALLERQSCRWYMVQGYGAVAVPFSSALWVFVDFHLLFIDCEHVIGDRSSQSSQDGSRQCVPGFFSCFIYPATRTFGLVGASLAILASMAGGPCHSDDLYPQVDRPSACPPI